VSSAARLAILGLKLGRSPMKLSLFAALFAVSSALVIQPRVPSR